MSERRWIVEHVGSPTFEQLATGLAGSELQSVLIDVMQRRAHDRSPADVLAQYERDAFCAPASVDQRTSHAIDGHLLAAASAFEAIELSPVEPLACDAGHRRDLGAVAGPLLLTDVLSALLFLLFVLGISAVFTWLRANARGRLFTVVIAHATVNAPLFFCEQVGAGVRGSDDRLQRAWYVLQAMGIVAGLVLVLARWRWWAASSAARRRRGNVQMLMKKRRMSVVWRRRVPPGGAAGIDP